MSAKAKPKRSSDRVLWCDRGWYPAYYGLCLSELAWKRALQHLKIPEQHPWPGNAKDATTSQMVNPRGDMVCIVSMRETKPREVKPYQIVGLMAHEAAHVWQNICEAIGEESPSREMEAYALQMITQELFVAYEAIRGPIR